MSLKKLTVSSVKWLIGASVVSKIISMATTVILARLLGPSSFGLFSLGLVIISAFGLFKSMGIDSALIQRKGNIEVAADTAFMIIPVLGVLLYSILYFTAPMIGGLLDNDSLTNVIRALGLVFLLGSLVRVPLSILEREMKFSKVSLSEICGTISFSTTAIISALLGLGVWSLVIGYIFKTLVISTLNWIFSKWTPHFRFNAKIGREMFNFGKFIFLTSAIWFLKASFDKLVVGKILGVEILGFYAIAFSLTHFGSEFIGVKIHQVLFSAYAKIQNDPQKLKIAFLRVLKYISLFALPLGVGIFLIGPDFLRLAFGDKWLRAIVPLQILAWSGTFTLIQAGAGQVFLALGKSKIRFYLVVIEIMAFVTFIIPASKYFSIDGVAIVVTGVSFLSLLLSFSFVAKLLRLNSIDFINAIKVPVISSVLMGISILMAKHFYQILFNNYHLQYFFIVSSLLGGGFYCICLYIIDKDALIDTFNICFRRI